MTVNKKAGNLSKQRGPKHHEKEGKSINFDQFPEKSHAGYDKTNKHTKKNK